MILLGVSLMTAMAPRQIVYIIDPNPNLRLGTTTRQVSNEETGLTQTRLYNVTDGAVQQNIHALDILGTSEWAYTTDVAACNSKIEGTFTIVAIKQFRIEYQTGGTQGTIGQGRPCNYGVEVYAQVKITKLDQWHIAAYGRNQRDCAWNVSVSG